jgi:hypothetical protein
MNTTSASLIIEAPVSLPGRTSSRPTSARPKKKLLSVLALSLLLVGCGTAPAGSRWARSEVFFGLSRPDGPAITLAEWQAFVNEVVTPKFPSGLTVVDSTGQWRHATGRIEQEPSKMLVLFHPASPVIDAQIDEIRALYCRRFNQEAVMKVTSYARVAF